MAAGRPYRETGPIRIPDDIPVDEVLSVLLVTDSERETLLEALHLKLALKRRDFGRRKALLNNPDRMHQAWRLRLFTRREIMANQAVCEREIGELEAMIKRLDPNDRFAKGQA